MKRAIKIDNENLVKDAVNSDFQGVQKGSAGAVGACAGRKQYRACDRPMHLELCNLMAARYMSFLTLDRT